MPDQTMIERVREAIIADIRRQGNDDRGPWVGGLLESFPGHTGIEVDGDLDPLSIARAAIAAMREPTEAMHDAGAAVTTNQTMAHDRPLPTLRNSYRAMIDAALEDGR